MATESFDNEHFVKRTRSTEVILEAKTQHLTKTLNVAFPFNL